MTDNEAGLSDYEKLQVKDMFKELMSEFKDEMHSMRDENKLMYVQVKEIKTILKLQGAIIPIIIAIVAIFFSQ